MIKANELRVGNWVTGAFGENAPFQIMKGFQIDDCVDTYFPILLTPEILERCGFEFIKNEYLLKAFSIVFQQNIFKFYYDYLDKGDYNEIFVQIKYLHQLQNLYFVLTGEELEIKELESA